MSGPRPFLKWAGGKRQILKELLRRIPKGWKTYFEPFLGGGALLFQLTPPKAVVSDNNYELINAYLVVRDQVEELIRDLKRHRNEKDYYYKIRATDPISLDPVQRASRFIYLNRTCYNGLYRENSKGEFNVPFGNYRDPKICDEENLRKVSEYLRGSDVQIRCCDYREALEGAQKGDFIYLDPPYVPVSETANFTKYTKYDFSENDQRELAKVFRELDKRGCFVMLSNSNTPLVHRLYEGFNVEVIRSSRPINSDARKRKNHTELIIRNYG